MFMTTAVTIPVSTGELIDKITILEIKQEQLADPEKLKNILVELRLLSEVRLALGIDVKPKAAEIAVLERELKAVNQRIWDAEDKIRAFERAKDFGDAFVAVARSIYQLNDLRASAKKDVNLLSGSEIVEEKGYEPY